MYTTPCPSASTTPLIQAPTPPTLPTPLAGAAAAAGAAAQGAGSVPDKCQWGAVLFGSAGAPREVCVNNAVMLQQYMAALVLLQSLLLLQSVLLLLSLLLLQSCCNNACLQCRSWQQSGNASTMLSSVNNTVIIYQRQHARLQASTVSTRARTRAHARTHTHTHIHKQYVHTRMQMPHPPPYNAATPTRVVLPPHSISFATVSTCAPTNAQRSNHSPKEGARHVVLERVVRWGCVEGETTAVGGEGESRKT